MEIGRRGPESKNNKTHFQESSNCVLPLHQQLRLKYVLDRLTVLRGKAMPSLYSWSCKRSYKNGFVWNDLAPNDVIYPSQGAEYVLKGSQLIEGTNEKWRNLQISHAPLGSSQDSSLNEPKQKSLVSKPGFETEEITNNRYGHDHNKEEEKYEEKTRYDSSTTRSTPRSRCSRGVSTYDITEFKQQQPMKQNTTTEFSLEPPNPFSTPPPSTTSSTNSEKGNNISKEFEEPLMSRNSTLLSLIACGGSALFRKAALPLELARKSGGGLRKEVVCKVVDEDEVMIGTMSENPRFGNLQCEENEYFSGSIVEAVAIERVDAIPSLKKSSSHNEQKSGMSAIGAAAAEKEEEVVKRNGVKGKCMPMKKSTYKQSKK